MSQQLKTITDYYDGNLHGMKGICETCLTFSDFRCKSTALVCKDTALQTEKCSSCIILEHHVSFLVSYLVLFFA